MSKFRISVTAGVAAIYPFGQQHQSHTLKKGQGIDLEVGPDCEPKMKEVAGVLGLAFDSLKADLGAPAAGVATGEPVAKRTGTLEVAAVDGAVMLRTYAGSGYSEEQVEPGSTVSVDVTESNKVTLAVYPPKASPR